MSRGTNESPPPTDRQHHANQTNSATLPYFRTKEMEIEAKLPEFRSMMTRHCRNVQHHRNSPLTVLTSPGPVSSSQVP
jgi:hypothetical protein